MNTERIVTWQDIISSDKVEALIERLVSDRIKTLIVTGGKSQTLPNEIQGVMVHKISEFDALASVYRDMYREPGIVVSIGTGTPFLLVKESDYVHLGGTGIGGGTIAGLGQRLLNLSNVGDIEGFATRGNAVNVNLTVEDIVGNSISSLPSQATASNFGKDGGSMEDIASGLFRMVGEIIGVMTSQFLIANNATNVLFVGATSGSIELQKIVNSVMKNYGYTPRFSEKPELATVRGAILYYFNQIKEPT